MLIGIKDNTGLGNNADELKTASILMDNTVIRPFQRLLIDAFDQILAFNDISLNLYFKTLQPLEFTDTEDIDDEETKEEETGVKLSTDLTPEVGDLLLNNLDGESMGDEWEEVTSRNHCDSNESIEEWASKNIEVKKTGLQKLQDFIKAKPDGFSYLDKSFYKVRYRYKEEYPSSNSRDFCIRMMLRSPDLGVVYRLEDIDKASRDGVNDQFGHKGEPYDLFKYKGGVTADTFGRKYYID